MYENAQLDLAHLVSRFYKEYSLVADKLQEAEDNGCFYAVGQIRYLDRVGSRFGALVRHISAVGIPEMAGMETLGLSEDERSHFDETYFEMSDSLEKRTDALYFHNEYSKLAEEYGKYISSGIFDGFLDDIGAQEILEILDQMSGIARSYLTSTDHPSCARQVLEAMGWKRIVCMIQDRPEYHGHQEIEKTAAEATKGSSARKGWRGHHRRR